MEKLRPGDIFTHAFAHVKGRIPLVNEQGKVEAFAFAAQKLGIVLMLGTEGEVSVRAIGSSHEARV